LAAHPARFGNALRRVAEVEILAPVSRTRKIKELGGAESNKGQSPGRRLGIAKLLAVRTDELR